MLNITCLVYDIRTYLLFSFCLARGFLIEFDYPIQTEAEFNKYMTTFLRKALKSCVFSKIPFIDEFHHGRMNDKDENLHGSASLSFPRMSIPYYKEEYSMSAWGSTYFFSFDALFGPLIVIKKRSGKRLERNFDPCFEV